MIYMFILSNSKNDHLILHNYVVIVYLS
uniref:Uncharacterized protein n=1 Tax=Anguilla anguilla TaxID=7936 RepID=A0A0E9PZQ0_ANGAN